MYTSRTKADSTLLQLARQLEDGRITSRRLLESCLHKINDPNGQGAQAFRTVEAKQATESANAMDARRKAGRAPSPFAGIPISIKDLFDIEGEQTLAASVVLAHQPAATQDAPVIARLRVAGFVFVGRTNMTEFAYSGLGLNPHYGTPLNPYERSTGRIPGGSTSGGAVSVADGMAMATLGTDTGGSCRIPAALCGIVGFKPTARRISRQGLIPLSFSLDSVGPLANTVSCCAVIDAVASGVPATGELPARPPGSLRIGVLRNHVFDGIEDQVADGFERALAQLSATGCSISDVVIDELNELPEINAKGGLASAEAFAWHKPRLATQASAYDPRVRVRIENGALQNAADYLHLLRQRHRLIGAANAKSEPFDAVVYPTVPFVAPPLDALADDDEYARINALALRNPGIANFLDRCAVSIPIHLPGEAPIGMNVLGNAMADRELLAIAAELEAAIASSL